ncbi:hypothetical protein NLU14_18210 [Marinobacter sp. 71-i]|uniref:Uncharacterized protein n=1 Tax=Marinobacter iranensis TaxID=2962607 RepID=A0ABT5YEP1_9GAMM|nr:hypothetical protein [Marinobacter iranensis]MDF0752167.1 hypothetical protein [Marinobacter iranensis]
MKYFMYQIKASYYLLCLSLLVAFSGHALAEPTISEIFLSDRERIEQGARVKISGDSFGTKKNAPPILIDYVDKAFEYGVVNEAHAKLDDMSRIPAGIDDDAGAVWATNTSTFLYSEQSQNRHGYSTASYFLQGENAWVGRPVAYGGPSGWDTPVDNPQLYVSWWYKNEFHSTYYWRFSPDSQKGTFEVGEELFIEGQEERNSRGVYAGVDADGLHNAVLYYHRNANELRGRSIKGISSGAVTVFPDQSRGGSGYGYEIPGSKLARIWDDPSGSDGIRSSVALHNAYAEGARMYYSLDLEPDKWVHIEYEIDTEKGMLRLYENGNKLGEEYFPEGRNYQGKYSPTLALLGTNAKQLKLQKSWISEIYVDSSLQRVAIGNAPKYSEVSHHELQRPLAWNNSEIEFAVNLGSFGFDEELYVYVFDKDGVPNSTGFPLCTGDSCPVPPSRIELLIN